MRLHPVISGGGRFLCLVVLFVAVTPRVEAGPGVEVGPGFRSGGSVLRLIGKTHEPGKVPVVFIHGMLASPAQWSVIIEQLAADPAVCQRFEFWTFGYDTFQSSPNTGHELAGVLEEARRRLDPEGLDPSFDPVVLVGHSLGGLVAKACAKDQGDRTLATGPPRVGRFIFIATPHRGSAADRGLLRAAGTWIARKDVRATPAGKESFCPTSVDELTWDHPLLHKLELARRASGIPAHSIIPVLGNSRDVLASDGVVALRSARLPDARSELVVRTTHAASSTPTSFARSAESSLPIRPRGNRSLKSSPRMLRAPEGRTPRDRGNAPGEVSRMTASPLVLWIARVYDAT
jgi:pimeloyl-ACP methyl ester carboxylesterase